MFKGNSITQTHLDAIRERVPSGTILEFGSGFGTNELAKYYNVFSIEHDKKWMTHHSTLVPIKNDFYDLSGVELPDYDAILVDGPQQSVGDRRKFAELDIDMTVPIFIDDVHRNDGKELQALVENKTGRKGEVIDFVSANGHTNGQFVCI